MLFAGIPFSDVWRKIHQENILTRASVKFVRFIEKRLGANFYYDEAKIPHGLVELVDLFELAAKMRQANIINDLNPTNSPPDEPRFFQWRVECNTTDKHATGGMSINDQRDALIPALAEAMERYLWLTKDDHFVSPQIATVAEIKTMGPAIEPKQFVGYTEEQRQKNHRRTLLPDTKYLWVKGFSHVKQSPVFIPAQIVSGLHGTKAIHSGSEPLILQPITTGLATGPNRDFALLNGALEILERDAFMITWLNQLTPPRIDIDNIAKNDPHLRALLEKCARYRLSVTAVTLPTDAPTHAVCVIIRDDSGQRPNVTIGLKAHRSLCAAVKGAAMEALRIRQTIRFRDRVSPLNPDKPVNEIVHVERAQYWGAPGSADKLSFLTKGPIAETKPAVWENDSIEEHWQRIISWCRASGYECASIDVGRSKHNVSPWKIQMVTMPEMQPMHQTERLIYLGGQRLTEVPKKFGFSPRSKPYTEEPHPFA